MNENRPSISELYAQFKASQTMPEPIRAESLLSRIIGRKKREFKIANRSEQNRLREQIDLLLRNTPGRYPLKEIAYRPTPPFRHTGFDYSFDYSIDEDTFTTSFWSYNHWGILVQEQPAGETPEIEIFEKTEDVDREFLEEGESDEPYVHMVNMLHLPKGFQMLVGPLHFDSESVPHSDEEVADSERRALAIAKAAGIKNVSRDLLYIPGIPYPRKYIDRFFIWQPELPDEPGLIAIDFDQIEPHYLAIKPDDPPVITSTTYLTGDE